MLEKHAGQGSHSGEFSYYSDRQTRERDVKIFGDVIELKSALARAMFGAKSIGAKKGGCKGFEIQSAADFQAS